MEQTEPEFNFDAHVLEIVRKDLANTDAIGVVFGTQEFDDGYFLGNIGYVVNSKNIVGPELEFDSALDDAFFDEFGAVTEDFIVSVDLVRNVVESGPTDIATTDLFV
jgi:hypothetical protein